jgi:hypothetical protein
MVSSMLCATYRGKKNRGKLHYFYHYIYYLFTNGF